MVKEAKQCGGEEAGVVRSGPPDCFGGLQPEEGACLLAGNVAFALALPHHERLQL